MTRDVNCPHCGSLLELNDIVVGEVVQCPACLRNFAVPQQKVVLKKGMNAKKQITLLICFGISALLWAAGWVVANWNTLSYAFK